jgi:hypothetical protein
MLDNSLPIRNEMMAARQRWTILLVSMGGRSSLPVLFVAAGIVASFANGTFASAVAELFPVGVRFSGVGTAMNLGLAASMGTAPLIASVLVARMHWPPAPALFMVLCATLAFVASFGMKQASGGVGA